MKNNLKKWLLVGTVCDMLNGTKKKGITFLSELRS